MQRIRPPDEAHQVFEDQEQAEGDEELVLLRAPVERPQQRRLEHGAQRGGGDRADRQERVERRRWPRWRRRRTRPTAHAVT